MNEQMNIEKQPILIWVTLLIVIALATFTLFFPVGGQWARTDVVYYEIEGEGEISEVKLRTILPVRANDGGVQVTLGWKGFALGFGPRILLFERLTTNSPRVIDRMFRKSWREHYEFKANALSISADKLMLDNLSKSVGPAKEYKADKNN